MPFIKNAVIGLASAIGVGSVFYTLGGVAERVFPTITPYTLGVVGFASALAIALAGDMKTK